MARKRLAARSGRTILVVDDQDEVLVSVRALLERAGHCVVTASAAADALAVVAAGDVHLVLVDHVMPEVSGEELIAQIRSVNPSIPIFLHTARAPLPSRAELIARLAIEGYHDKADGPDQLLCLVDAVLAARPSAPSPPPSPRPCAPSPPPAPRLHDLIAEVSHELRHPLQCIGGFADLLLDGSYGELPEQARAPLLSLACSAHDLHRVVSNVVTHTRLEAQALNVDRRRVVVADLTAEVRSVAETLLAGRPVHFAVDLRQAPVALHSDPQALRAIVYNLLDNAAKFTARGLITFHVVGDGSAVRLAMVDTGVGIAPERLTHLFEPFQRGDQPTGLGLGLALSRQLAELLGGELRARSVPGAGSTFTLVLRDAIPRGNTAQYFRAWEEDVVAAPMAEACPRQPRSAGAPAEVGQSQRGGDE